MNILTPSEYDDVQRSLVELKGDASKLKEVLGGEQFLAYMATKGQRDLYFFNKGILGHDQMVTHLHGKLCRFAQSTRPRRRGYLLPRGHFKSTAITIGKNLWRLIRDPSERIGIFHEKATQAQQFLQQIKHHLTMNELLKALYPERIPRWKEKGWRWTVESINVPRPREYPEPSIYAAGQGSALQGFHFTSMTWDDLIGEEAAGNSEVMNKVIDWMTRAEALSVTPETLELDLIGTRWAYYDIYSYAQETYDRMEWFECSAIVQDDDGHDVPIFPERFTMESLMEIKRQSFYSFSCQYMNKPTTGERQEFDPAWLRYYGREEKEIDGTRQAYLHQEETRESESSGVPLSHLTVFIHGDPGLGIIEGPQKAVAKHSRSAIVVVGCAYPNRIYVLDVWAKKVGVEEFIEQLLRFYQAYDRQLSWLTLEKHSWTRIVKPPLLQRAKEMGLLLTEGRIKDYTKSANQAKDGRIRSLQPYFANGQVFLHRGMVELEQEYRDFPLGKTKDILDAFSQGSSGGYWRFSDDPEDDPWEQSRDLNEPEYDRFEQGAYESTGY
jgi:predicted phage terminase large subunit-like protein